MQAILKVAVSLVAAVAALSLSVLSPTIAFARSSELSTGTFSSLAVSGYDTVAYFKMGKPQQGSEQFSMQYNGALWRFASKENLDAFRANPTAFAPQYGGYCAWALAQNSLAPTDPNVWKIVGGRLYLNFDRSVQAKWEKDIPGFIAAADRNWPAVLAN